MYVNSRRLGRFDLLERLLSFVDSRFLTLITVPATLMRLSLAFKRPLKMQAPGQRHYARLRPVAAAKVHKNEIMDRPIAAGRH